MEVRVVAMRRVRIDIAFVHLVGGCCRMTARRASTCLRCCSGSLVWCEVGVGFVASCAMRLKPKGKFRCAGKVIDCIPQGIFFFSFPIESAISYCVMLSRCDCPFTIVVVLFLVCQSMMQELAAGSKGKVNG